MVTSAGEELLIFQLRAADVPTPGREYRFDKVRRWRFDLAWPAEHLAVEVEGGVWSHGRHVRGAGYTDDLVKYNTASLQGWRVLRFTPSMVESGQALEMIEEGLVCGNAAGGKWFSAPSPAPGLWQGDDGRDSAAVAEQVDWEEGGG